MMVQYFDVTYRVGTAKPMTNCCTYLLSYCPISFQEACSCQPNPGCQESNSRVWITRYSLSGSEKHNEGATWEVMAAKCKHLTIYYVHIIQGLNISYKNLTRNVIIFIGWGKWHKVWIERTWHQIISQYK